LEVKYHRDCYTQFRNSYRSHHRAVAAAKDPSAKNSEFTADSFTFTNDDFGPSCLTEKPLASNCQSVASMAVTAVLTEVDWVSFTTDSWSNVSKTCSLSSFTGHFLHQST